MVLLDLIIRLCYYRAMESSFKVAVIIDKSRTYERELLRGISRYSKLYSQWIYYPSMTLSLRNRSLATNLKQILLWKPDGLIMNFTDEMSRIFEKSSGIPSVFINYPSLQPATSLKTYISIDQNALAVSGARYLMGHGFKNYAFCGYRDSPRREEFGLLFRDQIALQSFQTHILADPGMKMVQEFNGCMCCKHVRSDVL